ncbi:hypothetical protein FHR84_002802 [Actinopolyspora biskrensis]|uniref:Uncharacterized protein n=1 Tax=Actinopolyspora biskrensis TaxID=1470178 RepID=A0A852YWG7_9ACTN|nr:hypothetical protein [Actinopolyspora biskrensis]
MDPSELYAGVYVVWDPPEGEEDRRAPGMGLVRNHPGIIISPHWQDVGVKWFLKESDMASTESFYRYQDLRKVTPLEFLERCEEAKERANEIN